MKTHFSHKNTIITHGTSGLGKAIAEIIAQQGGMVILLDSHREKLKRTVEAIQAKGGKARGYICNLSNKDSVRKTIEQVEKYHRFIEILINTPISAMGNFSLNPPFQGIDNTMNQNTIGSMYTSKALLPNMIEKNRGQIINIMPSTNYTHLGFDEGLKQEIKVAKRIVSAITKRRKRLIMNLTISPLWMFRYLPKNLLNQFTQILNINKTIEHFSGRHH